MRDLQSITHRTSEQQLLDGRAGFQWSCQDHLSIAGLPRSTTRSCRISTQGLPKHSGRNLSELGTQREKLYLDLQHLEHPDVRGSIILKCIRKNKGDEGENRI